MTKTTVIYHRGDFDGIFCREIAKKFLPEPELIGWDYGEAKIPMPEGQVYILDLSPECIATLPDINEVGRRVIWIDHHKSAIEKWPAEITGYRIDGVAACRLAWQWFTIVDGNTNYGNVGNSVRAAGVLPMVQDFKNREVNEPIAVRLAGEYDIWDKRDPDAEVFQFGLRSLDLTPHWRELLSLNFKATIAEIEALIDVGHTNLLEPDGTNRPPIIWTLLEKGRTIQRYQEEADASTMAHRSFTYQWEGLTFLCLNTARCNSNTFKSAVKLEHDALMGFYWNGQRWTVSLYHAPHRTDIDLSLIAVKYGGGGHRGACGFTSEALNWLFPVN